MSTYKNPDWQRSIALAFTSGGFFGYLLRSIRPIAILTSMVAGAALGSLVTYEYFDIEQKNLSYQALSQMNNFPSNNQRQYEYFHE